MTHVNTSSYLKSNDETESDCEELPVDQCVVPIVVSESLISNKTNKEVKLDINGYSNSGSMKGHLGPKVL